MPSRDLNISARLSVKTVIFFQRTVAVSHRAQVFEVLDYLL